MSHADQTEAQQIFRFIQQLQCYASKTAQNNVQLTYGTQQAVQQPKTTFS